MPNRPAGKKVEAHGKRAGKTGGERLLLII